VPTEKRQRQREGRDYRRAQVEAERRRRRIRRRTYVVGSLVLAVALVLILLNVTGGKSTPTTSVSTKGSTTTTAAGAKAVSTVAASELSCFGISANPARKTQFSAAPPMCINPAKNYTATVQTDIGTFQIKFDPTAAPKTVNNFVFLSLYHFYDGVVFHRVIPGFVVQGGDPLGTGSGGPGYQFADELPKAGAYQVGSVAMANSGPNTNGSQFFVVVGSQGTSLPPQYSLFGQVTSGMNIVQNIAKDGAASGTPTVEHKMLSVTIQES